jgi:hypothetical protein
MYLKYLAIAVFALSLPSATLADPAGTFDLRGKNADNKTDYTGKVTVTRTGATYKVVWKIGDNDELSGTGVGMKMIDGRVVSGPASEDDIGISIAYGSGDTFGTVVYFEQPDGTWHGVWAYDGWDHISTEDWFPKERKTVTKVENKTNDKVEKDVKSFEPNQSKSAPTPALSGPRS